MFEKLFTSRRFWTFIIGQILTIATAIVAHYFADDQFAQQMATYVISFVEGLTAIIITAYTIDDTASHVTAIKMGVHPYYNKIAKE